MPKSRRSRNKPAPAPYDIAQAKKNSSKGKGSKQSNPLIVARKKQFGIGQDLPPQRDLTHFVKWPKYVRLQRQKRVLYERLKVPPAFNQFNMTADKNTARQIFSLLNKYAPETKQEKAARIKDFAAQKAENAEWTAPKPPPVVKYGIKHVTALVEQKKAKFVVIAHDVDPIEVVVWLPTLCRKMGVPYAIVKGKARLGVVVHKKTATCLALTKISGEDTNTFNQLAQVCRETFNDSTSVRKTWGGQRLGPKSQAAHSKKAKAMAKANKIREKI